MKEWIYGRNPVYEVLRAGKRHAFQLNLAQGVKEKGRLAEIVNLARKKKLKVNYVPRQQLDKLDVNHQAVAVEASGYSYRGLEEMLSLAAERGEQPFILVLDTLQDPQNLGTLLRTAEAVGVHGVLLPLRRAATITPAVVAASSGASEHLLVGQANLAQAMDILIDNNLWLIGLDGGPDSQPLEQVSLTGPLGLVVGNEGQGMRRLVREKCDVLLRLPMRGQVESLNAAVAGSVALYLVLGARASGNQ
jgi:23S rRNA (guanosine2251-2'-O)-methyltransferase